MLSPKKRVELEKGEDDIVIVVIVAVIVEMNGLLV